MSDQYSTYRFKYLRILMANENEIELFFRDTGDSSCFCTCTLFVLLCAVATS